MPEDIEVEAGDQNSTDTVTEDILCLNCDYNLRGLSQSGQCPECGFNVRKSVAAHPAMSKRELAVLAFRVTAIWYFLRAMYRLAEVAHISSSHIFQDIFVILLFTSIAAGIPVLIWWIASWLSKRAIRNDGRISLSGPMAPKHAMIIACSVIGLVYTIFGVQELIWLVISFARTPDVGLLVDYGITSGFKLLVGVVMIAGAVRISEFIIWLRFAGTKRGNQTG